MLSLLDQTKALWRLNDYAAMEKRFALAKRLNTRLSPEARRAGYLHAEMFYYQQRFSEAADAMLQVQSQHEQAGDLGLLEKSDIYEMDWVLGMMLFTDKRYAASLPHVRGCAARDGEHLRGALSTLIAVYANLGRIDEALQQLRVYIGKYGESADAVDLARYVRDAAQAHKVGSIEPRRAPAH